MDDLDLEAHRDFISAVISKHVDAELVFVDSKENLGGKLGMSRW